MQGPSPIASTCASASSPRPGSPGWSTTRARSAGSSPPIGVTRSEPASSRWEPDRSTARSSRGSRASRASPGRPSTPAAGTMRSPEEMRSAHPWIAWPTCGWASSGRGRPGSSASAGPIGQGALRLPAHALLDRCPEQPRHRSEWYAPCRSDGSRSEMLNFHHPARRAATADEIWSGGWTDISQRIRDRVVEDGGGRRGAQPRHQCVGLRGSDDEKMERSERASTGWSMTRPPPALKPWYRQLCKRPASTMSTWNLQLDRST